MDARGIRNNNPLNIVHVPANKFNGLATPPDDGRFCVFTSAIYGIRAAVIILIAYRDRHGCVMLADFIKRWAPHTENNVDAYGSHVSQRSGIGLNQTFDPHNYDQCSRVVAAMIWHENGKQPYTSAEIDKALTLAGVEPVRSAPLISSSRTVKGGGGAVGAGLVATVTGALTAIEPALPAIQTIVALVKQYPGIILGALGVAAVVGGALAIYAKWDDRRRGIA